MDLNYLTIDDDRKLPIWQMIYFWFTYSTWRCSLTRGYPRRQGPQIYFNAAVFFSGLNCEDPQFPECPSPFSTESFKVLMCVEQTSSWDLGLLSGAARLFTATLTSSYMPHSVAHVASTEQRRGDFMIAMTLVSFHICERILTLWPSGWQSFCSWWNFYFSSTQRNKKLVLAMLGCAGCGPLPTPHVRIGKCYPRAPWICDSNHAKMASCMRSKKIRPGTRNGTRMWELHSTGHQHWWIGYHFNACRRPTEGCHAEVEGENDTK